MSEVMKDFGVNLASQAVFRLFDMAANEFFKKWRRAKATQEFIDLPETETYLCSRFVDGESQMKRVFSVKDIGDLGVDNFLAQVNTTPLDVEILYAGLTGKEGISFDLTISATVKIKDARKFLTERGLNWATSANSAAITVLETLLANQCKQQITDEMHTLSYNALTQQEALPLKWWKNKLANWFSLDWLELVEMKTVQYASTTADKAKEIKERQKISDLELESQQQIHQIELQRKQDQQAYEEAMKQLETNSIISEQQRQAELEKAKLTLEKATVEAKQKIDLIKSKARKQQAELEAEIDRIRNRDDLATQRLKQAEESEKRTQETLKLYNTAKSELDSSIHLIKDAIHEGLSDAKRVSEYAGGLSSGTMELLGRSHGAAYLSRVLKEKAYAASEAISMKMEKLEIGVRDIGTKKVDSLSINSALQFEFFTQKSGYATILNLGTSGKTWLQCPNAYVGIENTKVDSGEKYRVPGQLLPGDELMRNGLGYMEVGPPGWEELVVIVSDKPLVTEKDLFKSTSENPFMEVTQSRIDELLEQLSSLDEKSWDVGILSFLVE